MLDELRRRFESEVDRVGVTRIASALGISRGTVYNWLANGNVPLDKLMMLKEHGVDVLYIITGQYGVTASSALKSDEAALLDNYRHSPPEGQAASRRQALRSRNRKVSVKPNDY